MKLQTNHIDSPFTIQNEIAFWGTQIKEHMMLLYLALVDQAIEQANLSKQTIQGKAYNLREEALFLQNAWTSILGNSNPDVNEVKQLMLTTMNYHERLTKALESGWIGWASYSLNNHMMEELRYFWSKVTGAGYKLSDELNFWLWHDADEVAYSDKLIDPLQINLSNQAHEYINRTKQIRYELLQLLETGDFENLEGDALDVLYEYVGITEGLREGIRNKQILTNIPLAVVNHVIREGERSLEIFEWLLPVENQT